MPAEKETEDTEANNRIIQPYSGNTRWVGTPSRRCMGAPKRIQGAIACVKNKRTSFFLYAARVSKKQFLDSSRS